jgi:hypothetical protein
MKLKLALMAVLLAPLPAPMPALAHHSYSMFDMNKTVAMQATVVRFKWQNPHAFIEIDATSRTGTERWAIEMNSPNNLTQEGWRRTSLKPGDRITLWVHPLRNGARGGSYAGVRLPNGTTLGQTGRSGA